MAKLRDSERMTSVHTKISAVRRTKQSTRSVEYRFAFPPPAERDLRDDAGNESSQIGDDRAVVSGLEGFGDGFVEGEDVVDMRHFEDVDDLLVCMHEVHGSAMGFHGTVCDKKRAQTAAITELDGFEFDDELTDGFGFAEDEEFGLKFAGHGLVDLSFFNGEDCCAVFFFDVEFHGYSKYADDSHSHFPLNGIFDGNERIK